MSKRIESCHGGPFVSKKIFIPIICIVAIVIALGGAAFKFYKQSDNLKEELSQAKAELVLEKSKEEVVDPGKTEKEMRGEHPVPPSTEPMPYQNLYPNLYAKPAAALDMNTSKVYLTFDDGPSKENTLRILDTLKAHGIHATFFVVGTNVTAHPEIIQRIVAEGHALGVHSDTHDYKNIYVSVDTLLNDYEICLNKIKAITDYPVTVCRLPGGSINAYNYGFYQQLNSELLRRGFVYYDWNVDSGDATPKKNSPASIVSGVLTTIGKQKNANVLMHDSGGQTYSADNLDQIVTSLQASNVTFDVLSNAVPPVAFGYKDF